TAHLLSVALRSLHYSFSFHDPAAPAIYPLSLHDALPISRPSKACASPLRKHSLFLSVWRRRPGSCVGAFSERLPLEVRGGCRDRSEEHTSELQSRENLVCRLLLEKKKRYREKNICGVIGE